MICKSHYLPLGDRQQYIDKTECLQKGIVVFPSIYIEGFAASGKSTLVRMFLEMHPEMEPIVFDLEQEMISPEIMQKSILESGSDKGCIILENAHAFWNLDSEDVRIKNERSEWNKKLVDVIRHLPEGWHMIMVSRNRPPVELLDLIWKKEMLLISSAELRFSEMEVRSLLEKRESGLTAPELYAYTNGWPGCVNAMIHIAKMNPRYREFDVEELCGTYEISEYIRCEVLSGLSEQAQELMRRAVICPWLNEKLCEELWQMPYAAVVLEDLERKGLLIKNHRKNRWTVVRIFTDYWQKDADPGQWRALAEWYELQGHIEDALYCLEQPGDKKAFAELVVRNYDSLPLIKFTEIKDAQKYLKYIPDNQHGNLEISYIRALFAYMNGNIEAIEKERKRIRISKESSWKDREIYLNLAYLSPELSIDEWVEELNRFGEEEKHFHLYHMLGYSHTYLCSIRDMSNLFACTKKEEKRKARIWKTYLGAHEWRA